jgi:hypothetical protein
MSGAPTCDIGPGERSNAFNEWSYQPACGESATVRYRSSDDPPDMPWSFRCDRHAEWLNRGFCTVEPLAGEVPA